MTAARLRALVRAAVREIQPQVLAELLRPSLEAVALRARREIARRAAAAELAQAGPGGAELAQAGGAA